MPPRTGWLSGVYRIRNTVNGKVYIGSCCSRIESRWSSHKKDLRAGRHHSRHLQKAWDRYGPSAFAFEVVERCSPGTCLEREQYWIDETRCYDRRYGYNISAVAGSRLGVLFTEEQKAGLSASKKAQSADPSFRARQSEITKAWWDAHPEAKLDRPKHTEETRAHLSKVRKQWWATLSPEKREEWLQKNRGWKHREETKKKISIAATGRKHSEETKARMSESMTGLKRSAEARANMSRARKGRDMSKQCKAAAEANRGKKHSPETITKMKAKRAERKAREAQALANLVPLSPPTRPIRPLL